MHSQSTTDAESSFDGRQYHKIAIAICVAYLLIEIAYVLHRPLIEDEFHGAVAAWQVAHQMPYRDYQPYKTILGYAIQAPLVAIAPSTWTGMILVKLQAALLVTLTLLYAVRVLPRHFERKAILLALGVFLSTSTFLERSAELRVDMLTGICGFIALLLLLEQRHAAAGLLSGLSFLVSQKGAFYPVAGGVAIVLWIIQSRDIRRGSRAAFAFAAGALAPLVAYFALFSLVAPLKTIFDTTFLSALRVAQDELPELKVSLRERYWPQVISRDPGLWLGTVAGLAVLVRSLRTGARRDAIVLGFGAAILAAVILLKQPWPYSFVLILPTLFVVSIVTMEMLHRFLTRPDRRRLLPIARAVYIGVILLSLIRVPWSFYAANGAAQRRTLNALEMLLGRNDGYFAAIQLLYSRPEVTTALRVFDHRTPFALLAAPKSWHYAVAETLHQSNLKFLVRTYMVNRISPPLRIYLRDQYDHLWGHIYVYAPRVWPGTFELKYDGHYRVYPDPLMPIPVFRLKELGLKIRPAKQGPLPTEVTVNGRRVPVGTVLHLRRGRHTIAYAGESIRLQLMPPGAERLDARFRDQPDHFFHEDPYGY